MAKRHKTRQEKIIAQLRRQLAQNTKIKTRQEAIFNQPKREPKKELILKKPNNNVFFYNPQLIKKDLIKTLILALIIIGFEAMLYLKLR